MPRVVVVGAGIVGLACAFRLRQLGAEVVVLDRARPGGACSQGNAGWITPSLALPIPAPGVVAQSLRWLLSRRGPLFIQPLSLVSSPGWYRRFWRASNARDYESGRAALAGLTTRAMPLLAAMRDAGVEFEMHEQGMLLAFRDGETAAHMLEELRELASLGLPRPEPLEGDLREWEPALRADVRHGIRVDGERHVRPETVTAGLVSWLGANAVRVVHDAEVVAFAWSGGRVAGARLADGSTVECDEVLLAAGVWTGRLARLLDVRLPMQGGKGYTITLLQPSLRLRQPLYLDEVKVACSPFEGAARFAGMMEMAGLDGRPRPDRARLLAEDIGLYLSEWRGAAREEQWTGLRPLTPDGLPAIGRAPGYENAWIATGHAMVGVTLAAPTAWAIADLILGCGSDFELAPFDPGRF